MNYVNECPKVFLQVDPESLSLFTTVLQSGIEVMSHKGEMIGQFLDKFPGFTLDYLADTVQTIFLNGTALDDLTTPFPADNPVLALSAAMPGLAGAIFRRNSFHAALRTDTGSGESVEESQEPVRVTLKLFNSIAVERGPEFLASGVLIKGAHLANFFDKRATLLQRIRVASLNDTSIDPSELSRIGSSHNRVHLTITTSHG